MSVQFSSVQFRYVVLYESLRTHW